jgi:hypothetical protein
LQHDAITPWLRPRGAPTVLSRTISRRILAANGAVGNRFTAFERHMEFGHLHGAFANITEIEIVDMDSLIGRNYAAAPPGSGGTGA